MTAIITASGLGDIFWCLQKLHPVINKIDIIIAHSTESPESRRSLPWMSCFPCVRSTNTQYMPSGSYNDLLLNWNLDLIITDKPQKEHKYALNKPLETGTKLQDIDQYPVDWNLEVITQATAIPYSKYQILYMSSLGPWQAPKWAELANSTNLPTLLMGRSWDAQALQPLAKLLEQPSHLFIDHEPTEVLYAIQTATLFIGYQSGLNVMADRLHTPQIMIYFDSLRRLMGTWNNPKNKELHKDFCFFDPFEEILKATKKLATI